jgi:site-specific recombinase XerD
MLVAGFRDDYQRFIERVGIDQKSKSLVTNYGRSLAALALHFGRSPHRVGIEELNGYLYRLTTEGSQSASYFKHTVYALRHWLRLFGMEEKAIQMPSIRKDEKLPVVLSKAEVKELIGLPAQLKHRYLLALAYGSGLRMNELRLLKISDVDVCRKLVHVRMGKGRKDRYVVLSELSADGLARYLQQVKPRVYLFEGQTPAQPMGERSIQYIISEALKKSNIHKEVSMHTLRHSFATHLLEEGVDLHSIQRQLGHADLRITMRYLHVAQIKAKPVHSPLDSLYGYRSKAGS